MARTGKREAAIFAALGDPARLRVVARLAAIGPLSIAELTVGSGITRQAVSKHLRALEAAGLARSQRRGRERMWRLRRERLEAVRGYLSQIEAQWDAALGRLRQFVENG